ncbi:DUF3237 domain-containing protein [Mycobacterium sp. 852002-40037_SCH5390672]|uniref:DUF3237 domain-containing protein n=1 Tax=Mycobacterium sp. 852002-40037_SCH5390672 TaxID=1834089 RepID=UPI0009EDF069|nr:DUF3237 domain-containing protein [Mycobacterium sp. 852002-40037_SCH5390672]
MEILFEATVTANLQPPVMVGPGPQGVRVFIETGEGIVEGERLNGKVLPVGGDWALIGPDGWCRLDVRTQLEMDDGAAIYVQLHGLIEMNDATDKAFADGVETGFDDQYFRVIPQLQSGDPNYEWVNETIFIGEGRFVDGFGLQYHIFRVA